MYRGEEIAAGPKMTAAGIVGWKDRLIIADHGGKRLVAFTPPDRIEIFLAMRNPVGVAVDPVSDLIVTEKDVGNRVVRVRPDGKVEELAPESVGTPLSPPSTGADGHLVGLPRGRDTQPGARRQAGPSPAGDRAHLGITPSPKQDKLFVSSKLPDASRRAVWHFPVDAEGGSEELRSRRVSCKPRGMPMQLTDTGSS